MNIPVNTLEKHFINSKQPYLSLYIQYINGNIDTEEMHSHNYFQIIFIDEGEAKHCIEYEPPLVMKPYEVSVVFPKQIHQISFKRCRGIILMFDEVLFCSDILKKELSAYNVDLYRKLNHIVYDKQQYQNIRDKVEQICILYNNISPIKKEQIRFYIKILLLQLIEYAHEKEQPAKNLSIVNVYANYKELIEKQYHSTKTVSSYAQQMGISVKRLNNICKQESGMTALAVLHERVMVEAKRMLLFSGESIKEISFKLGFTSPSAFNKFIYSKTNKTPTELKFSLSQNYKQKD